MIESHGKILISAFVVILVGVILIQAIGDEVERVKLSSFTNLNESISLSNTTVDISNESIANTGTNISSGIYTVANDDLTILTEIRNDSATVFTAQCNTTSLVSGVFVCNITNSTNLFFEYTYVSGKTGNLAETDEILSLDGLRNITHNNLLGACNITLSTGALGCNNTRSSTIFADYQFDTDAFVSSGTARTILTLTVLFFALFILAIGLKFVIEGFKRGGMF